jgi:ferric-dicitrate binding protein FerR (iron transport regulator)
MSSENREKFDDRLERNRILSGTGEFLNSPAVENLLLDQWNNFQDIKNTSPSPDFDKIFGSISSKLPSPELSVEPEPKRVGKPIKGMSVRWLYSAAAMVAGLIILGGFLYKMNVVPIFSGDISEITTSKGEKKEIILPDGTKVWLNADSKIIYKNKFGSDLRKVKLFGEAYFDVVKNPKWPFLVETSQLTIKVLGTKFNVKAYQDDKTIETTLESGLISLQQGGKLFRSGNSILVKPQQKATFSKKEHRLLLENVDSKRFTSWKEGRLVFDNEEIHEAIKKLERWYGLKISMMNECRNDRITLTITDEGIEDAIKLLQYTTASGFKVENLNTREKLIYKYEHKKVEKK